MSIYYFVVFVKWFFELSPQIGQSSKLANRLILEHPGLQTPRSLPNINRNDKAEANPKSIRSVNIDSIFFSLLLDKTMVTYYNKYVPKKNRN